jgi:hypothetical protein
MSKAQKAARTYGLPRDIDPGRALLEEVQNQAGVVAWLRHIIGGMDAEDLVWGMAEEIIEPEIRDSDGQTVILSRSGKYKAAPSVWLSIYQWERRHYRELCRDAIAAGVSERMVNVFEQTADTFALVIERVLDSLDLTETQRLAVPAAVVRELRVITGETETP